MQHIVGARAVQAGKATTASRRRAWLSPVIRLEQPLGDFPHARACRSSARSPEPPGRSGGPRRLRGLRPLPRDGVSTRPARHDHAQPLLPGPARAPGRRFSVDLTGAHAGRPRPH
jgi:hypothetical protein